MNHEPEEKRSHVRIQDQVLLKYRPLSKEEFENLKEQYEEGSLSPWPTSCHPELFHQIYGKLKKVKEKDPNLAGVLEILDQKLNLIFNLLKEGSEGYLDTSHITNVDISAAGLAFQTNENFDVGQLLELDMGLLPQHIFFRCYGEVVRSEPSNDGCGNKTAVKFIWITPDDQDRLTENIFKKQVLQLRMRRNQNC